MLVQLLHPDAILPSYKTAGAACFDLYSFMPSGSQVLKPGQIAMVGSGLKVQLEPETVLKLYIRSGLGAIGIHLANGTGIIDSDYRGEVKFLLQNSSQADFVIHNQERLVQGMIVDAPQHPIHRVLKVEETARGAAGFGSTGRT